MLLIYTCVILILKPPNKSLMEQAKKLRSMAFTKLQFIEVIRRNIVPIVHPKPRKPLTRIWNIACAAVKFANGLLKLTPMGRKGAKRMKDTSTLMLRCSESNLTEGTR